MIILFQAYIGGRLVEFIHVSKGKASQDLLGEAEDTNKGKCPQEATEEDYDDESDAGDSPEFNVNNLFDSNNNNDAATALDEGINEDTSYDSSYGTEDRDVTITNDIDDYSTIEVEVDELGEPLRQAYDVAKPDEFREAVRKYKVLYYEDICLWIVQNPNRGERDFLVIEVSLQYYKGVNNKPKLYVTPPQVLSPS